MLQRAKRYFRVRRNEKILRRQLQTIKKAAEKTADWWIEKMMRPFNQNNGDDSAAGALAFLLTNTISNAARDTATDNKVSLFKEALVTAILNNNPRLHGRLELDVDYAPCRILSEACQQAGLDSAMLPMKTFTLIDRDGKVTGRYQYGGGRGPWETIFEP